MSELDAAIDRFRAAVLREDAIARQRLIQAYADALRRLRPLIELVELDLLSLAEVTPYRIFQLDRWRDLERQLFEEIARIGRIETLNLTEAQRQLVAMAADHSRALALVQAAPVDVARLSFNWVQLPANAVEALIGATVDGAPLMQLFERMGAGTTDLARGILTDAMALGQHPRIVANALSAVTDQMFARTYTIARTEMLRAYRTASIRNYAANSDILDGWVWVAAKSKRTCAACLALDGRVFPLEERFMRQHVNCRCSCVASVRGVPWQRETGSEWLAKQPKGVQDAVLGKKGGEAYRAGDVELGDFIRRDASAVWGPSYRDGGVTWAKAQAGKRTPTTKSLSPEDRILANVNYPESTKFSGLSDESVQQIADALDENMARFIPKAGKIDYIDASAGFRRGSDDALMAANSYQGGSITYNIQQLEAYRIKSRAIQGRRFGVSDTLPSEQRVSATFTHEWGHIIQFASPRTGVGKKARYEASERFADAFKALPREERQAYRDSLSDYGLTNTDEFFAESYTKYVYERDDMPQSLIDAMEAILKDYGG